MKRRVSRLSEGTDVPSAKKQRHLRAALGQRELRPSSQLVSLPLDVDVKQSPTPDNTIEQVGSEGDGSKLPSTLTFNGDGELIYENPHVKGKHLAIFHQDFRGPAIEYMDQQGTYIEERWHSGGAQDRNRNNEPTDKTAFHPAQQFLRAEDRSTWPDILVKFEPTEEDENGEPTKRLLRVNGYLVVDHHGDPIIDRPEIPLTLSSRIENHLLVLFWRLYRDLKWEEIECRVHPDYWNKHMMCQARSRWIAQNGVELWSNDERNVIRSAYFRRRMTDADREANSVLNVKPLDLEEQQELEFLGYGTGMNNTRKTNKAGKDQQAMENDTQAKRQLKADAFFKRHGRQPLELSDILSPDEQARGNKRGGRHTLEHPNWIREALSNELFADMTMEGVDIGAVTREKLHRRLELSDEFKREPTDETSRVSALDPRRRTCLPPQSTRGAPTRDAPSPATLHYEDVYRAGFLARDRLLPIEYQFGKNYFTAPTTPRDQTYGYGLLDLKHSNGLSQRSAGMSRRGLGQETYETSASPRSYGSSYSNGSADLKNFTAEQCNMWQAKRTAGLAASSPPHNAMRGVSPLVPNYNAEFQQGWGLADRPTEQEFIHANGQLMHPDLQQEWAVNAGKFGNGQFLTFQNSPHSSPVHQFQMYNAISNQSALGSPFRATQGYFKRSPKLLEHPVWHNSPMGHDLSNDPFSSPAQMEDTPSRSNLLQPKWSGMRATQETIVPSQLSIASYKSAMPQDLQTTAQDGDLIIDSSPRSGMKAAQETIVPSQPFIASSPVIPQNSQTTSQDGNLIISPSLGSGGISSSFPSPPGIGADEGIPVNPFQYRISGDVEHSGGHEAGLGNAFMTEDDKVESTGKVGGEINVVPNGDDSQPVNALNDFLNDHTNESS